MHLSRLTLLVPSGQTVTHLPAISSQSPVQETWLTKTKDSELAGLMQWYSSSVQAALGQCWAQCPVPTRLNLESHFSWTVPGLMTSQAPEGFEDWHLRIAWVVSRLQRVKAVWVALSR